MGAITIAGDYEISVSPLQTVIHIYDKSKGESAEEKTRYTTSLLLTDLGLKECRLHLVQGALNPEINGLIYQAIKRMGYVRAQYEVPAGTSASRLGEYQYTRDGLDRYVGQIK